MERNAALLREIAGKIEAEPRHYYQGRWTAGLWAMEDEAQKEAAIFNDIVTLDDGTAMATSMPVRYEAALCGTAFCISGWALHLSGWGVNWNIEPGESIWWPEWTDPSGERHYPDFSAEGARALGLYRNEAAELFAASWQPREGLSVPDALRALADGASVEEVSR